MAKIKGTGRLLEKSGDEIKIWKFMQKMIRLPTEF
jgi:hypothetical protein